MCKFFSLLSNGKGEIKYFDWKKKEKLTEQEWALRCLAGAYRLCKKSKEGNPRPTTYGIQM